MNYGTQQPVLTLQVPLTACWFGKQVITVQYIWSRVLAAQHMATLGMHGACWRRSELFAQRPMLQRSRKGLQRSPIYLRSRDTFRD